MEVRLADHFGLCFGVRDAIELAVRLTRQGPVTILGDLVHNPTVVAELDSAGASRATHASEVATRAVLLTAHGTANRVKLQLREKGHQIHDAACPLVKRVHHALDKLIAEGRHPVVIGQPNHVEVLGLVGDLHEFTIVENQDDLEKLVGRPRLGVVSQTTQPLERVMHLVGALKQRFPESDIRFVDTVCQPTKDRQESLRKLAEDCDTIIVVGGPESNNSRKLTELARQLGRRAYQVAGAQDLRSDWFVNSKTVGITAGTSTPDHVIEEVRACLEEM
ncbi:MAG TPA: 4-hydroxy-3-methylbut-2-enyl diphosphate reductase [Gemmataceae bacterium]|nr:4-hydroxy-3-methylbut-2-enyl diphosphate reductase [Gemmataceae bacterium]